jgi:hypothetical protein
MTTIAAALGRAVRVDGDGRGRFEAGVELSSWPGIVHGGALAAALDEAGRRLGGGDGPRRVEARLTASVPIASALALDGEAREGGAAVSLVDRGQPLSMATVAALGAPAAEAPEPPWRGGATGFALPTSETCLACGAGNSLGLQLALAFDDEGVWVRTIPRAAWRADGGLHPALAPVVLDEVAWWLGALVMREGGLTNRIAVELLDPEALVAADGEIAAAGRFADVVAVDRRKTFWRTAVALTGPDGRPLARAAIVFRGGAEYSERQIPYFRPRTPPEVFRRMFPNHW